MCLTFTIKHIKLKENINKWMILMTKIFTKLNKFLDSQDTEKLTTREHTWLKRATKLAKTSKKKNFKLGAIIIQSNKKIGCGVNSFKTHPIQSKWNQKSECLHAEISAIIDSGIKDFEGKKATIFVARLMTNEKDVGCSYPCINCWNMLNFIGIRNIVCYDKKGHPVKIKVKE